ncbi:MAG TPA: hypothetical protein VGM05_15150 [Planctomycetaceae bacterium]|jgi:hypothetical protein
MIALLPALAIAFTAFCVWLGVRIVNRHERWAKWALALVIVLPMLYVGSFGPACWLACDRHISQTFVAQAYRPIIRLANASPDPIRNAITTCSGDRPFAFSLLDQPGMLGLLTDILDGKLVVR